jgi:hypothetical protein
MVARCVVTLLALVLAIPLSAQQMVKTASPADVDALKSGVQSFETLLRENIYKAGRALADWANQIQPNVMLEFAAPPVVRTVVLPDESLVFHVEVAQILPTYLTLFEQAQRLKPRASEVSNSGMVSAKSDPLAVSASPDQMYTQFVYTALVDAVLDHSRVLAIKEGQTLTVACNPVDVGLNSRSLRTPSKQLILSIKGEDLHAFRKGTLSRDEAKQRIVERRF